MVSQDNCTVVRHQMNGTHKGKFFSLKPTKKKVSVSGIDIWKLKGSKAVEHHGNFDALGMLVQMKVMPELK